MPLKSTTTPAPAGRCKALTRAGSRCTNRISVGPVCGIHAQHPPDDLRREVRRARRRELAARQRRRAASVPIVSGDELGVLVDHVVEGVARIEFIVSTSTDSIDPTAADAQRRGILRDALVDALYQIDRERQERSDRGLRLIGGGAR